MLTPVTCPCGGWWNTLTGYYHHRRNCPEWYPVAPEPWLKVERARRQANGAQPEPPAEG